MAGTVARGGLAGPERRTVNQEDLIMRRLGNGLLLQVVAAALAMLWGVGAARAEKSAKEVLGDETLRNIARELAVKIRDNASIDWTIKETVRAAMRAMVKRLLRKYGYPPDKQEAATLLVLEQAELICSTLAA